MRVTIEPPEGWGPARAMLGELLRLGYDIEEYIVLGQRLFVIGAAPRRPISLDPQQTLCVRFQI